MKKYYEPLLVIIRVDNADMIRTSGEGEVGGGFMVEEQLFITN